MVSKISPDREEKKAHAITLRKQGWTERAIAKELRIANVTAHRYVLHVKANDMKQSINMLHNATPTMEQNFKTFNGRLEDFTTDIRFPLIIADPPWNVSVEGSMNFTFKQKNGKQHTPMLRNFGSWDFHESDEQYLQVVNGWLRKLYELGSENAWCWFWCSYRYLSHINNIALSIGWENKGWYVWAKTNPPPLTASINGTLMPCLEPCLIFRKGTGKLRANGTGHANYKEAPLVSNGERLKGSDNICAKPLRILYDFIEWSTEPGQWVLDAFAGTGSTTRAALEKHRNSYAVEMDKRQITLLELEVEDKYGIQSN